MRAVDLIYAKRSGQPLSDEEINFLVTGYVRDKIPDYQIAAFLMAVYFQGLSAAELSALTGAMMRSGEVFDFSKIPGVKADKHSTGGVGDKVSLILAPLAAACGLVVPMVAGRGLGHTGGTLDKLEAIPGFRVNLSKAQMTRQLAKIGVVIAGQTERFVPADKKLYALRDVTGTVESIPLIAASIMSKKLAEGADVLVLDVKVGSGAFMKDEPEARCLAAALTSLGRAMGRRVEALLTDMSQPTGRAVGNANEVVESIEALQGHGPADLKEITYALTARMLILSGRVAGAAEATALMDRAIAGGAALEKFRELIVAQGGDPRVIDDPRRLPLAPRESVVTAPRSGWLAALDTRQIGIAAAMLGAGRQTKEDAVDPGVGLSVHARLGDRVQAGQLLFTVRFRKSATLDAVRQALAGAITIQDGPVQPPALILPPAEAVPAL